jgi:hypothetical protein
MNTQRVSGVDIRPDIPEFNVSAASDHDNGGGGPLQRKLPATSKSDDVKKVLKFSNGNQTGDAQDTCDTRGQNFHVQPEELSVSNHSDITARRHKLRSSTGRTRHGLPVKTNRDSNNHNNALIVLLCSGLLFLRK